MKSIKMMIAAAAMVAMVSCCDKAPKQFDGFIADASMNTVTVKALTSDDTYTFSTMDADRAEAYGMLIGAPIIVTYTGKLTDSPIAATKVATDKTYSEAVGEWTMPDPIDPEAVMGVNLMVEGVAESINMATLVYTSWELQGEAGKVLLKGTSEGSGEPEAVTVTGVISQNEAGAYTMTIEGTEVVYTKAN